MKKNLWITVSENEVTGNISVMCNGMSTFLPETSHRQLWSMLKGSLPPKNVLSFIPPNHDNASRIVKDFSWPVVQQFVADVLKVKPEQVARRYQSASQSLVTVADDNGTYDYSIDHTTLI